MATFEEFAAWLFPGQEVPAVPNPDHLPPEVWDTLRKISNDTTLPMNWLEKTAGVVIDGLAGLQCLWYLHGAEGRIGVKLTPPDWVGQIIHFAIIGVLNDTDELRRGLTSIADSGTIVSGRGWHSVTDWAKGNFTLEKVYEGRPDQKQTFKIGKWLEKYIATKAFTEQQIIQMRDDLKRRAKDNWMTWRISAHPYDVLTMSYNRPWSSCMRPGSDYPWQYGILTDLAAGSAIMFFYRPGADQPAGRLILRPAIDKNGSTVIYSGKNIYGTGPKPLPPGQITTMLSQAGFTNAQVVERNLCTTGSYGRALSRLIYNDVGGPGGCDQDDETYDTAYERLSRAGWPDPTLDIGDLRSVAEEWEGEIECDIEEIKSRPDINIEEIVNEFDWFGHDSVEELLDYFSHQGEGVRRVVWEHLSTEHPHITSNHEHYGDDISEIEQGVDGVIYGLVVEMLQDEPALLIAYTKEWNELSIDTRNFLGKFNVIMIYKYKMPQFKRGDPEPYEYRYHKRPEGHWLYGFWTPDYPDEAIMHRLGMEKTPEELLPGGVRRDALHLAPEGPTFQLDLFEPMQIKTVVAIWLEEDIEEIIDEEIADYREDGLEPPFISEAITYTTDLPYNEDPASYAWHDFVSMER